MQAFEQGAGADDILNGIRTVLDEALGLGPRAFELSAESALLGAIPELDSQAVLHVLLGLEEQFGIEVEDDDVDAEVFETVGSLAELVRRKQSA